MVVARFVSLRRSAVCWFAFQCAATVENCSGELREGSPNPSGLVIATALTHQTMSRV